MKRLIRRRNVRRNVWGDVCIAAALFCLTLGIGASSAAADGGAHPMPAPRSSADAPCAAIARWIRESFSPQAGLDRGLEGALNFEDGSVHCPAAPAAAGKSSFSLLSSAWNPSLSRWQFVLRCLQPANCVPFMVWADDLRPRHSTLAARKAELGQAESGQAEFRQAEFRHTDFPHPGNRRPSLSESSEGSPMLKPGQSAMLRWDEGAIRIALPVICLEAAFPGQIVRVRVRNASRILKAQLLNDGTLRAGL